MTYFCWHHDLKMCRYLYRRGADTTDLRYKYNQGRTTTSSSTTCSLGRDSPILVPSSSSGSSMFPMYAAAYRGHTDVCQWLYDHGAAEDIHRKNVHGYTPFQASLKHAPDSLPNQRTNSWLIAHGAFSGAGSLVDDCQSLGGKSPRAPSPQEDQQEGPLMMTDHGQEYDYTRHRYQHQNQHNLPHPTKTAGTTTPTRGNRTTTTTAAINPTDHEEEEEDTLMSCVL